MNRSAPRSRTIVNLVASPFLGGPERQMLGLAQALAPDDRTVFLGFPEGRALHDQAVKLGLESNLLAATGRPVGKAVSEVTEWLLQLHPDVILTHGYKSDMVGLLAARRAGVPHLAISRGWTGATLRVRINEAIDKLAIRGARRVVAVSHRQGERVREAGVRGGRVVVIQNAIDASRFGSPDAAIRREMEELFPVRPERIVIAAGRLSPEKGFEDLIRAARQVVDRMPTTGFLLVGDGALWEDLEEAVQAHRLEQNFVLAGFRSDMDRLMANADLFVQSSHTEGMPNVVLEAGACSVPIVATAVGGTGEVVEDGRHGRLVPAQRPAELARCILEVLADPEHARDMAAEARRRIVSEFTFPAQAQAYRRLFDECLP